VGGERAGEKRMEVMGREKRRTSYTKTILGPAIGSASAIKIAVFDRVSII